MSEQDSFPFYCIGYECETEEEAWRTFKIEARRQFKWINGYKIWRRIPQLQTCNNFDKGSVIYQVTSRVIALEKPIDNVTEATVDGPYISNARDYETAIEPCAFALKG